ncbi:hypothetical protein Tco_0453958 [Tanacetum coccineum]
MMVCQIDVKTAFLNGILKEEVYILYRVDGGDFVENYGDLWFIVINNPFWKVGQSRCPQQAWTKGAPRCKSPSYGLEDSWRKRRRRVSSSSEDSWDNEEQKRELENPRTNYRDVEDGRYVPVYGSPKGRHKLRRTAFSDFSENKKRCLPANVKTYGWDKGSPNFDELDDTQHGPSSKVKPPPLQQK